jgi:hypothetical protein
MTGAGNGARSGALTSPTSAAGKADLGKFLDRSSIASYLDGAPVFMALSAFSLASSRSAGRRSPLPT